MAQSTIHHPSSAIQTDTRSEAERVQIELLRQAPAWRKLEMVGQMNETVRTLALSGLHQRFPHATLDELHRRLADLLLGEALAACVYGSDEPARRAVAQEKPHGV